MSLRGDDRIEMDFSDINYTPTSKLVIKQINEKKLPPPKYLETKYQEENDMAKYDHDDLRDKSEDYKTTQIKIPPIQNNQYTHIQFAELLNTTIHNIQQLSKLKGGEYAGDNDRLANFRRNGKNLNLPMEVIWAVYASKHWDAVVQYINDIQSGVVRERLESISGRLDDIIVYCILFKAMIEERENQK